MKIPGPTLAGLAAATLLTAPVGAEAQTLDAPRYTILPESRFEIRTTSEGIFGFAGDDHLIRAGTFTGAVTHDPDRPGRSRVELAVPTDSLRVLTPVDEDDREAIRTRMLDEVLQSDAHPEIRFRSTAVEPMSGDSLRVTGELTVRDSARSVTAELGTHASGDTLRVFGSFPARLTDFGIEPPGVAMGTVKVGDRVRFVVDAVLSRDRGATGSSRRPPG